MIRPCRKVQIVWVKAWRCSLLLSMAWQRRRSGGILFEGLFWSCRVIITHATSRRADIYLCRPLRPDSLNNVSMRSSIWWTEALSHV